MNAQPDYMLIVVHEDVLNGALKQHFSMQIIQLTNALIAVQ